MAHGHDDHDDNDELHRGLDHDLAVMKRHMSRRSLFGFFAKAAAGASLLPVLSACNDAGGLGNMAGLDGGAGADAAGGTDLASTKTDGGSVDSGGVGSCSEIPNETAGPYPGDGTNGVNALTQSGIVRSDIRASFGSSNTVAGGVTFDVTLTLVDTATCSPLVGFAVYLWHCDRDGNYSLYSAGVTDENYLRGVQETDANGQVTFRTIFPGCYSGRWPHIHFEMYRSLADATNGNNKVAVSQLALPKTTCDQVYATTGYSTSVTNLGKITIATDNVFSDGATLQIPSISGSVASDLAAALTVAIRD